MNRAYDLSRIRKCPKCGKRKEPKGKIKPYDLNTVPGWAGFCECNK